MHGKKQREGVSKNKVLRKISGLKREELKL
jgi:hypothetical protein